MEKLSAQNAAERAASLLGNWILGPRATTEVDTRRCAHSPGDGGVDALLRVGEHQFAVQFKARLTAEALTSAAFHLRQDASGTATPLLIVPFMSEQGRKRCAEAGIGWLDLSGNADVRAPGLRLLIDGQPNQFKRPGRVSSAFAIKGARVTRLLLQQPGQAHSQADIVEQTHLSAGHVSKVLVKLSEERLIKRRADGRVEVSDPDQLLDAWAREYDFTKHQLIKGIMPVRSGEQAMRKIATVLTDEDYVATGIGGAWYLDHFALFRTASVYLREEPNEELFSQLSFTPEARGANVWLIVPNDEGVFQGKTRSKEGVMCAHWVQIYVDLAAHPERSKEAAEHLRSAYQTWSESDH